MAETLTLLVLMSFPLLALGIGVLRARTGSSGPVWLMLGILSFTAVTCWVFPTPGNGLHGTVDHLGALIAVTGLLSLAVALAIGAFAGWLYLQATGRDPKERRHRDFYPDVILTCVVAVTLRMIA